VQPTFLMTDPASFEVSYQINPWMEPNAWAADPRGFKARAVSSSDALRAAIEAEDGSVEIVPPAAGWPDLVFPANAAVVLDGRVLLARFRREERQGEQALFRAAFERLARAGLVDEIVELPEGCFQEGAGDCIWDQTRELFWAAHGPRSSASSLDAIEAAFGRETVRLELATDRFYHLDTCFCPLSGGEILFYPPALTEASLRAVHANTTGDQRLEADAEDAAAFCVNAVNIGRTIIMAKAPQRLRERLTERGYCVVEVDLAPFMLSGGGAYCMTLRLDRASAQVEPVRLAS
jgi:N-dimethylarginine dimethylaminohydrolase